MYRTVTGVLTFCLLAGGCSGLGSSSSTPALVADATRLENGEPSHISVQHVLIGFEGSVQGKDVTRSQKDAKILAQEVLARAVAGDDFEDLVNEYTDDSPPGIYHLANFGQASDMDASDESQRVFPRNGMVPAFGDVGFPLSIGEIGISEYHPRNSPYGWHIIKRIR